MAVERRERGERQRRRRLCGIGRPDTSLFELDPADAHAIGSGRRNRHQPDFYIGRPRRRRDGCRPRRAVPPCGIYRARYLPAVEDDCVGAIVALHVRIAGNACTVRFIGERATVKLRMAMELAQSNSAEKITRKNFLGYLRGLEDGMLLLECEGVVHKIALTSIDKARLNPEF